MNARWCFLGLLVALPARAEPLDDASVGAARDLGYEGVRLFEQGDAVAASERLERAYRVLHVPSLGLWSARALAKAGKLVEASERYLETTRLAVTSGDVAVQQAAQAEAAREREELQARIPALIVEVDVEGAEVSIDGTVIHAALLGVRRPANPGSHRLEARLGERFATRDVVLGEGDTQSVKLTLSELSEPVSVVTPPAQAPVTPPPARAPGPTARDPVVERDSGSTQGLAGWISVAAGGLGIAVGTVSALMAIDKRNGIADQCPNDDCLPPAHAEADDYNRLRTISSIGFIAGGVMAATGVVLILTAPAPAKDARRTELRLGLGRLTLSGEL